MTLGQLLGELLGWLGDFVRWAQNWVPRYTFVACNELGVTYTRGEPASALGPGTHWYCPNLTRVVKHPSNRYLIEVEPISAETKDGVSCQAGCTITLRIRDVLQYEVENFSADSSVDDLAQGALQDIVSEHTWNELRAPTGEGTRLGGKLARRMGADLAKFGVEVESVRPTDLIRLGPGAIRLFGVNVTLVHPEPATVS